MTRTFSINRPGGSPHFEAPEIRDGLTGTERINEESDVYSLAMTIYALWTGRVPFYHLKRSEAPELTSSEAVLEAARKGDRPPVDTISALASSPYLQGGFDHIEKVQFGALLTQMWRHKPAQRVSMPEARKILAQIVVRHETTLRRSSCTVM